MRKRTPNYCHFDILKPRKCFIPRREMRSISSGGPIVFTYVLFWVRKRMWHFQKQITVMTFFHLKCFTSRVEMRGISCRGSIVFTYVLFWVSKTFEAFQFRDGLLPKKIPENVLSPGGTLPSRARKGSNCFYFIFYYCRKRYLGFQILSW